MSRHVMLAGVCSVSSVAWGQTLRCSRCAWHMWMTWTQLSGEGGSTCEQAVASVEAIPQFFLQFAGLTANHCWMPWLHGGVRLKLHLGAGT
jgi:hypothetical protein